MAAATLRADLLLNTTSFSRSLTQAATRMRTFGRNLQGSYDRANAALSRHTVGLRDVSRIVQGIVISQTFYRAVNAIREATSALTRFNETLDYTQVTYSALFGSTELASDFSKVLQEKAINSIFDYESLLGSSKKLLAYGIEYENLMYIMEGLMDLGSMSGDTAALDRIALALGQIQAKGKLSAEEMRQLANAYVPIQEIVQKSFNLTPDQMGSIGDLNLPANQVINAIVDYANEEFGGVADAAMMTITGLKNRVVDTMKVLGAEMTAPLSRAWKSFLKYAADGLQGLREAFQTGGWGGIFESLVPDPALQTTIRAFLANIHNGIVAIASLLAGIKPMISTIGQGFMVAFNFIAPVINTVIHALGALLHIVSQSSAAMSLLRFVTAAAASAFVLLKIRALGALVITAVGKAIAFVSKQMIILSAIVAKHPLLMLMAGLAVALVGVAAASNNADNGLSKLFKTLSGAGGGVTQEDILKKTTGEINNASAAADQFNKKLGDGKDAAKGLEEGINNAGKKAAKAAAGLLSFDEVFKLNEPKDSNADGAGAGAGLADDIDGLISGLGTLGDALIPDIPDFSEFTDKFTNQLFGDLYKSVERVMSGAMTGGLVGALVGFAIGGLITRTMAGALAGAKLGAKIGAAAGAGFALFWGDAYEQLEAKLLDITAGAGAGALLGALGGFIIGAFATRNLAGAITAAQWGAGIGALAGGVLGGLFDNFYEELQKRIDGIAAGGAEGMLVGGLAGMIIGAFATRSISGALTGARIGAGLGALIGGTIGGIFDEGEASMTDALNNMFSDISAASYGSVIGGLVGMIIGAIVGALAGGVGAIPGAKLGATLGAAIGGLGGLLYSYLQNSGISEKIGEWFNNLWTGIGDWFSGLGTKMSEWWSGVEETWSVMWDNATTGWNDWLDGVKMNWSNKWDEISTGWNNWWGGIEETWSVMWNNAKTGWNDWLDGVKMNWSNKWDEIGTQWNTWKTNAKESMSTWWNDISKKFSDGLNSTKEKWSTKWTEIKNNGIAKWNDIKTNLTTWLDDVLKKNGTSLDEVKDKWSAKWNDIKTNATKLWGTIKTDSSDFLNALLTGNTTKLDEIKTKWSTKWDEVKTKLSKWWDDMLTSMKTWLEEKIWQPIADFFKLDNFWNRIKGLLTSIKNKLSDWWDGITDIFSREVKVNASVNTGGLASGGPPLAAGAYAKTGHATGGIFNREHIARFAEGNKAEAIIPLENYSAMQPFVTAVSRGLLEELAPALVQSNNNGSSSNLPPMYVGTLIADERGLKQLYKKFELIEMQENARRGLANA